jgi:hypothetical protein
LHTRLVPALLTLIVLSFLVPIVYAYVAPPHASSVEGEPRQQGDSQLRAQLAEVQSQRDQANRELDAARQQLAKISPPSPMPNPLHDEATKWRLAKNLRYLSSRTANLCEVVIVRYQESYSEHYSDDIKDLLTVVGWNYHEAFASTELPTRLSLRAVNHGESYACEEMFRQRLNNDIQPALNPPWSWASGADMKYMKECSGPCFELDVGNKE